MKITESKTYIATPLGATIKEMMEDQGKSVKEFAYLMGLSYRIDMRRLPRH